MSDDKKPSDWPEAVGCLGVSLIFGSVFVVLLLLVCGWRP